MLVEGSLYKNNTKNIIYLCFKAMCQKKFTSLLLQHGTSHPIIYLLN